MICKKSKPFPSFPHLAFLLYVHFTPLHSENTGANELLKEKVLPELPPPLRFFFTFHFIPLHSENTGANDY